MRVQFESQIPMSVVTGIMCIAAPEIHKALRSFDEIGANPSAVWASIRLAIAAARPNWLPTERLGIVCDTSNNLTEDVTNRRAKVQVLATLPGDACVYGSLFTCEAGEDEDGYPTLFISAKKTLPSQQALPSAARTTMAFERRELWTLIERADEVARTVASPRWARAYEDFVHAASVLDAFLARSTVH